MDPAMALSALGGAARTHQLLGAGCSKFEVRTAANAGAIRAIARGVYALPDADRQAVAAATLGAGFTCVSALQRLGLPVRTRIAIPHLAVPRNFNPAAHAPTDARFHYQEARPVPCAIAGAAEALDACGVCVDEVWHLVAVDAALNRGLITLGDVLAFRRTSRERRDYLLRLADARAEAPGETIARAQLVRAGFAVRPQAYIDGAGHVDLEVEGLLILQVDGYGPHSGKPAFTRDRTKGRAVIKAGRPQLSYAAAELLGTYPVNVADDVRQALKAWRERDQARVVPSGRRIVTIARDDAPFRPSVR